MAWDVFADWSLWPRFSDWYGTLRWTQGEPWKKGSRLRIEILKPIHTHVDHVILVCDPGKRVAWIDHALGTTMEQWVFFEPLSNGGTRIHTWAEFTGILTIVAGRPIRRVLQEFTYTWYNNYCAECNRRATNGACA
jgi:hypothetical protein